MWCGYEAMTRFARRYRKVARGLSRLELMATPMEESFGDPRELVTGGSRRFLDFYGDDGIRMALERYGVFEALRRRGYDHFELTTRVAEDQHTLIIVGAHPRLSAREHLVELVVRRDRLVPDVDAGLDGVFDVLTVDWLTLRHPAARFTRQRPRLPGQDAPGLGLGEHVAELLYRVVDRLRFDGLLTVPEYFHNAVIYGRELKCFDPAAQGRCDALVAALIGCENLSLAQASWAIEWGQVYERGSPIRWRGEAQLRATCAPLARYLESSAHKEAAEGAARGHHFALDRERFEAKWAEGADTLEGRVSRSAG